MPWSYPIPLPVHFSLFSTPYSLLTTQVYFPSYTWRAWPNPACRPFSLRRAHIPLPADFPLLLPPILCPQVYFLQSFSPHSLSALNSIQHVGWTLIIPPVVMSHSSPCWLPLTLEPASGLLPAHTQSQPTSSELSEDTWLDHLLIQHLDSLGCLLHPRLLHPQFCGYSLYSWCRGRHWEKIDHGSSGSSSLSRLLLVHFLVVVVLTNVNSYPGGLWVT